VFFLVFLPCSSSCIDFLGSEDTQYAGSRYAVAEWYGAGLTIERSWVRISLVAVVCVPMPTQRAVTTGSVND